MNMQTCRVDLTRKEINSYSIAKVIEACRSGNWSNAGQERAITIEAARVSGQTEPTQHHAIVPYAVLHRDLGVSVDTSGGFLAAALRVTPPRDTMYGASVVHTLGANIISGVPFNNADIQIPRFSANASGEWLVETTTAAESTPTLGIASLSPKIYASVVDVSREILRQANADHIVLPHLGRKSNNALDVAALHGTGTEQPLGVVNTTGVGVGTGGSFDFADALENQTDTSAFGDPRRPGYVTHPATAAILANRAAFSTSTSIWSGPVIGAASMAGLPAVATVNCSSGTLIFGDWSELTVVEYGAGIESSINPVANFKAGIEQLRVLYVVDSAVTQPGAFSVTTSLS